MHSRSYENPTMALLAVNDAIADMPRKLVLLRLKDTTLLSYREMIFCIRPGFAITISIWSSEELLVSMYAATNTKC
jgi:hypothetical protein